MVGDYLDLGKGKWKDRWISKQDLVEYSRCPYRVYVAFSRGIAIAELKETQALQAILQKGLYLESQVVKDVMPLEAISNKEIEPLRDQQQIIQIPTIIRNHDIGIRGIPDLIDTANGAFIPYEIKSHSQVQPSDEWELAFYWLLLEPLRTKNARPRGCVVLSDFSTVKVNLTQDLLLDVEMTIEEVREIESCPPQPTLGEECKLCQLREQCTDHLVKKGRLSIIQNISYRRQSQFETLGIKNIAQLARAKPEHLNSRFMARFGNTPGVEEIHRMKCHALSYKSGKPYFFGSRDRINGLTSAPLLVVDLEYSCPGLVWLVGCALKEKRGISYHQYFAEKPTLKEEKRILNQFASFLREHSSYVIITYNGISADIPQLENACERGSLSTDDLKTILRNHTDLCDVLKRSFRFPMKSFELDSLEKYLEIERQSPIFNGLDADGRYHTFLMTKDTKKKERLRKELLDYNREDVQSTLQIITRLPEILTDSLAYDG
jgi:predicted RecB family nuclease